MMHSAVEVIGLPALLRAFRVQACQWDMQRVYAGATLQSPIECASLADVFAFLSFVQHGGLRNERAAALREAFDDAVTPLLDRYIREVYVPTWPGCVAVAPSWLRGPRGRHLPVAAEFAWKVLSLASSKRLTLVGVADVLATEESQLGGVSPAETADDAAVDTLVKATSRSNTAPWRWLRRKMAIHLHEVRRRFGGCQQLSVAADASTYDGESTLVAKVPIHEQ